MAARRKYKDAIKVNSLYDREKMKILRSIYGKDATIINKGLDLLLGLSYEGGKIKSEYLSMIRDESLRLIEQESNKVKEIDDLLNNRIQAEARQTKVQSDFKKMVKSLNKSTLISGNMLHTEKLMEAAESLSNQLGINVTVKMLIDEIEAQEASA